MRATRRPLALDGLIVALGAAAMIELWTTRRSDAAVTTTVLAVGATATLIAWRRAPAFALLAALAAQVALLESMPRPMISMAVALALTAALAGATSSARTWASWSVAVTGLAAAVGVAADYAFRARGTDATAAFGIAAAAVAVCWACACAVVLRAGGASTSGESARVPSPSGAPDGDVASRRLLVTRSLADELSGELAGVIVETVAAQQALVRGAHPDDVLVRMRAAEEHGHTATAGLRRLLAAAGLNATADDPSSDADADAQPEIAAVSPR
jgi:hypothetical protein